MIKDIFFKINNIIYLFRVKLFESEKLINDLKMRELELKQKQELIEELLLKLNPKAQPDLKEFDPNVDGVIINPIWQLSVIDDNKKEVIGWPFLYWVHYVLKAQGFDPDNKLMGKNVRVRVSMDVGKYVQFPLYIKGKNLPIGTMLTTIPPNIGEIDKGN